MVFVIFSLLLDWTRGISVHGQIERSLFARCISKNSVCVFRKGGHVCRIVAIHIADVCKMTALAL